MLRSPFAAAYNERELQKELNMIGEWIKSLDSLLRGDATQLASLKRGTIEVPTNGLLFLIIILGAFYGACMACFAAFSRPAAGAILQMLASAGKIPLLFLLTLLVTFPSLYVFNALIGSRLTLRAVWQLLIATLAVMVAVLASLGPVVAFFSVSTTGYSFMLLFNVVVCAASGFLGLKFLLFTLHRLTVVLDEQNKPAPSIPLPTAAAPSTPAAVNPDAITYDMPVPALPLPVGQVSPQGALDKLEGRAFGGNVTAIFRIWIVVFALVGAQMSWVLRPFIGAPNLPFSLLRGRDSNFFEAVWRAFWQLLGG